MAGIVHGSADAAKLVHKGWLVIAILFSFYCSRGLLGELPLGRHDVVIVVAITAQVVVWTVLVTVGKDDNLENCSCKQDHQ